MRLSEHAHKLFAAFFSAQKICDSNDFPDVRIYAKRGSWLLTNLIMVDGITFGRHIFINPKFVSRDVENRLLVSKKLLAHELVHVLQYQQEGVWGFLIDYAGDFLVIFRKKDKWSLRSWFESYQEIRHETEARNVAAKFTRWLRKTNPDQPDSPIFP
jgi:hypothetical protein